MSESRPGGRGIGRGLAAILPASSEERGETLRWLPVELIRPNPEQPRRRFDEQALLGLAESIEARGLLQPLVVRPLPGGEYELVAGERRLRAARIAGLGEVPAIVRQAGDADRIELALIENMAREDLNPVDEARACATLVEDLGITKEELARRLGRSRAALANLIRLLELPESALELIETGRLSEGHGRAVLTCKDHERRTRLASEAALHGWSVRETEERAREERSAPARRRRRASGELEEALAAAADALTAALGREVHVRPRGASGCRAELRFDHPTEAVELAERLLRRAVA